MRLFLRDSFSAEVRQSEAGSESSSRDARPPGVKGGPIENSSAEPPRTGGKLFDTHMSNLENGKEGVNLLVLRMK